MSYKINFVELQERECNCVKKAIKDMNYSYQEHKARNNIKYRKSKETKRMYGILRETW